MKKRIYDNTQYVKSNKITPGKKILHLRCRWCRRHFESLGGGGGLGGASDKPP